MTESEKFRELIRRYTEGTASEEEVAWLESVYMKWNQNADRKHSVRSLRKTDQKMWSDITGKLGFQTAAKVQSKPIPMPSALQGAAAILVLFGALFFFIRKPLTREPTITSKTRVTDIVPGRNTAVLTLASGKSIHLSEAKTGVVIDASQITYNDGTEVPLSADGAGAKNPGITTVSTPRGGQYQVELPDKSKVWMNAASSIKFPGTFKGLNSRVVELQGEAYFEVFPDPNQPFIVKSSGMETRVLGTHFNVTNYDDDESIKVTLQEGSVRVQKRESRGANVAMGKSILLIPDQQATLENGNITLADVDAEEVIAWKNGKFVFTSENITTIMRKVARWYDVEVVFKDDFSDTKISGSISRFEKVSKLMEMLQTTGSLHYTIQGKKIFLSRNNN